MINRQLEINVNNERILERLAENLNIDFISDGSNLKKIADTYSAENLNFATSVDDAIANGFLNTMSSEFLELFGRQYSIYRKNYNNISVYAYQGVITLSVNKTEAMLSEIPSTSVLFRKGDLIYSDDNVVIESLDRVTISNINDEIDISARISLALDLDNYIIQEGSEFVITSSNSELVSYFPTFNMKFKRPVGLAVLQESEEDYRLRLYEATYLANNGANSLVASITKEVPFISFLEVDDYKNGRGIKAIYPYTQELIESGYDDFIDTMIIPLVETNLRGKILNGQLIEVLKPESLLLNIELSFKKDTYITENYLENLRITFNNFFSTYKQINREVLEDFIKTEIGINSEYISNVNFVFTSPYVSEETFTLVSQSEDIIIPKGRFLYLFITVPNFSLDDRNGLDYMECSEILKYLGCDDAMQFDGGHSTGMIFNGKHVDKPTLQRKVPTAIGFVCE